MKILLLFLAFIFTSVHSEDLTVRVSGIKKTRGYMLIGVFDNAADMEASKFSGGEKRSVVWKAVKVKRTSVTVSFKDLPTGFYAIGVIHDVNANQRLDTSLGKPTEPFGISRNPSVSFRFPRWSDVSFLKNGQTTANIVLKHL